MNHSGQLDRTNNVRPTEAPVTRVTDDDLEATAAVTLIMARLDRPLQQRVAAFVAKKWGTDD